MITKTPGVAAPAPSPAASAPAPAPVKEVRTPDITPVLKFISGLPDVAAQVLGRHVVGFVRNRFPEASGEVADDGFTFTLDGEHLLTATLGKAWVDLQIGPDRIAPRRIRDTEAFDSTVTLPSVAKGFEAFS